MLLIEGVAFRDRGVQLLLLLGNEQAVLPHHFFLDVDGILRQLDLLLQQHFPADLLGNVGAVFGLLFQQLLLGALDLLLLLLELLDPIQDKAGAFAEHRRQHDAQHQCQHQEAGNPGNDHSSILIHNNLLAQTSGKLRRPGISGWT